MVKHLQENTLVTHFLKLFIAMLTINFLLMLVLLVNQTLNEVFLLAIFALISINTFALFYLIIKKI